MDHEDEVMIDYYPLWENFMNAIAERGWTILDKIGEGSTSTVFSCEKEGKSGALVLFTDVHNQDHRIRRHILEAPAKITLARNNPDIFVAYHSILYLLVPYSDDPKYLARSKDFGSRPIQIMQRAEYYIHDYVMTLKPSEIRPFVVQCHQDLLELCQKLLSKGFTYHDLSIFNLMMIKVDEKWVIRFIDADGLCAIDLRLEST